MIRFNCTFCGRPVRVANVCAGKKGRCPSCQRVIDIPPHSDESADGELPALAQAVEGASGQEPPCEPAPPPPVRLERTRIDEVDIASADADPSTETDILPAEHDAQQGVRSSPRAASGPQTPREIVPPGPPPGPTGEDRRAFDAGGGHGRGGGNLLLAGQTRAVKVTWRLSQETLILWHSRPRLCGWAFGPIARPMAGVPHVLR